MFESGVCESLGIVELFVQSDDGADVVFPEVGEVHFGGVQGISVQYHTLIVGPGEGQKLIRQNPVEISVVHTLKLTKSPAISKLAF